MSSHRYWVPRLVAGGDEAEIAQMTDDVTIDLFAKDLAELAAGGRLEISVRLTVARRQFLPMLF